MKSSDHESEGEFIVVDNLGTIRKTQEEQGIRGRIMITQT